jgi:integrase
VVGLTEEL